MYKIQVQHLCTSIDMTSINECLQSDNFVNILHKRLLM